MMICAVRSIRSRDRPMASRDAAANARLRATIQTDSRSSAGGIRFL